jgi:hypothetical protein
MMEFIKMAALGAVLSYSAVSAYNQPVRKLEAALSADYQDRIPSTDDGPKTAARRWTSPSDQAARLIEVEPHNVASSPVLNSAPQTSVAHH